MWIQILLRVLGYLLTGAAPAVAVKSGSIELGSGVGLAGGYLLNKTDKGKVIPRRTPKMFPTTAGPHSEDPTPSERIPSSRR